jgi:hypothetical protein
MPPVPQPVAKCLVVGFYDVDPTAPTAAQVFVVPAPADLGTAAQVAFDAGFEHAIVVKVPSYYTRPDAAA